MAAYWRSDDVGHPIVKGDSVGVSNVIADSSVTSSGGGAVGSTTASVGSAGAVSADSIIRSLSAAIMTVSVSAATGVSTGSGVGKDSGVAVLGSTADVSGTSVGAEVGVAIVVAVTTRVTSITHGVGDGSALSVARTAKPTMRGSGRGGLDARHRLPASSSTTNARSNVGKARTSRRKKDSFTKSLAYRRNRLIGAWFRVAPLPQCA